MSAPQERKTILLVDDDDAIRQVLGRVLGDDGYTVYAAGNVAEALDKAQRHCPQVALLDYRLPDGTAVDLADQLRALQPDLPLLLMTGEPVSLLARPELAKQFMQVMTKPMNLEELRRAIKRALGESSQLLPRSSVPRQASSAPEVVRVPALAARAAGWMGILDRFHWLRSAGIVVFALLVLVAFVVYALGLPIPGFTGSATEPEPVSAAELPRVQTFAELTDRSLASLRKEAIPEPVLLKLQTLKDREFETAEFRKEIDKILDDLVRDGLVGKDEQNRIQNSIQQTAALHKIAVPDDVMESLGIRKGIAMKVEPAETPRQMRPLSLSGSTALNPTTLMRVRANFAPTKVLKIGQVEDYYARPKEGPTVLRDLRSGDSVKAGDVLAEFYSMDVASRKSDIVDALVQLRTDQENLRKAESTSNAVPPIYIENARRLVKQDESTLARARRQLQSMGIPEEDILEVYKDAEELLKHGGPGKGPYELTSIAMVTLRALGLPESASRKLEALENKSFKTREPFSMQLASVLDKDELERWQNLILIHAAARDPEIEKKWARVVLKATVDGVIVERNVNVGETVVDNTVNLFQIAKPDKLLVIGNADERDLPELLRLQGNERSWTVFTAGGPPEGITAAIDDIGHLIDPNQHSAVVKGYIDNPGGRIRGGQLVTALVQLPPPGDVMEIPISALIDEGDQTFVFVQNREAPDQFFLRRVKVTQRFEKKAFVKRSFNDAENRLLEKERGDSPYEITPLKHGDRVLTAGVLLLKKELQDQEAGG
jgi:cobalt-zinc-cadmium efflux system membrane fusion protein